MDAIRYLMLALVVVIHAADGLPVYADRPNIVLMLSDDQAWDGLSVAMHPEMDDSKDPVVQTPSLEGLAAQGMRFSAAYAPASVCSPTRCSLQTGKSAAQNQWTKAAPTMTAGDNYPMIPPGSLKVLSEDEVTIGELLREAGYATAHFGKWHLRAGGPGSHGYDEHDGNIGNEYAGQYKDPNPVDIFGMAERADAFMQKNTEAGKPFFIQMSWHALHAPQNALEETISKYESLMPGSRGRQVVKAAIAEDLDTGVGRVLDSIERLGIAGNTYVIFMSDNGAGVSNALRGGKGSVWEGGIRVPMIVRGPGVAPGSWCHTRVVGYDWFPTFCEWAGIERLPEGIEGGSLVGVLNAEGAGQVQRPRRELVFHFPHYQSEDGPHTALMFGDLKLMKFYESGRLALFDLSNDIREQHDVSSERPGDAEEMHRLMQKYLAEVNAGMPVVNPDYDPSKPSDDRNNRPRRARRGRG